MKNWPSLGLVIVTAAAVAAAVVHLSRENNRRNAENDAIDRASADSFPASDAPSMGR
jgi:hypothetical protein